MESLLQMFNLSDRYLSDFTDLSIIGKEIDYKRVNTQKEQYIEKSKTYLGMSLS